MVVTLPDNPADATLQEPDPPSGRLRWLLLGVCGALLVLLLLSGAMAVHYLGKCTRRNAVTHALSERTQMLSRALAFDSKL